MKRFFAYLLCAVMLLALAAPALADAPAEDPAYIVDAAGPEEASGDSMDQALAEVTLKVKETLDVDNGYTEFSGDLRDNVTSQWSLNWSDDTRSLSVTAAEDGKVMSVYRWHQDADNDMFYGFDPVFPSLVREDAEAQADEWLDRLMGEGETARVEEVQTILGRNGYYRFSGTVDKNGLPSPITFNLELNGDGLYSYDRSDGYLAYVGDVPSEKAEVGPEVGTDGLVGAISMELYYVSDGEGNARLQYVPVGPYTVVDALTGESTDMDALYASMNASPNNYGTMPMAEAAAAADTAAGGDKGVSLTETELSSIENYAEVMTQAVIDDSLRAMDALGLNGFTLQRCSYSADGETGDVTASLRYTAALTEDNLYGYSPEEFAQYQQWGDSLIIYKYISLNAKTGALESVSTSYPLWTRDESIQVNGEDTQDAAAEFLKAAAPDMFPETAVNTLTKWADDTAILFLRTHDGYFFPENYLRVALNPATGTVDSFNCEWDEDVAFAASEGIVGPEEAAAAYAGALDVTLGYVAWPVDITMSDEAVYARYLEWGYVYVEELRLAYYFDGREDVAGVDALTGEPVTAVDSGAGSYEYTDLDGAAGKDMIEALGAAGVGFEGGRFRPEETLTQRDAVVLLLRAGGYTADEKDDAWLGERAAWNGFVAAADWDAGAAVTAAEFMKMIIGASRYGDAAELLSGGGNDEGYTAIAQALGLLENAPAEDGPITRADAAALLHTFMSR